MRCQGGQSLARAFFNTLGNFDFAFAGQQIHSAHFTHIHTHRIGGTAKLIVHGAGQCSNGLVGHIIIAYSAIQQSVVVRRELMHINAHVVNHGNDVFDLIRIDNIIRQVIVDFVISQITLFFPLGDQ